MHICIVDYGVGNLFSVAKAFGACAAEVHISEDAGEIAACDALILPGVGSFQAGMNGLMVRGLTEAVKNHVVAGKPLLGICLGAQLLLSSGEEFGKHEGLGIIDGRTVHFPPLAAGAKIPHVGWNTIAPPSGRSWDGTPLGDLPSGTEMYFVHSFILQPNDPKDVLAQTEYGGCTFASAIRRGNVYGCQFHPEKSGEKGLQIIRRFLEIAADQ